MKINFLKWLEMNTLGTEYVDESKIDALYQNAKISVKLVQLYDKFNQVKLLHNINTILPLNSNVYGLYMSGENKKVIGNSVLDKLKLIFPKDQLINQKIQKLPNFVIKKYIPDLNPEDLKPSDTIHVNIKKIVDQYGDSKEAIIEIASTIVHEATHEIELQSTGKTDEIGPQKAEKVFVSWVFKNWNMIQNQIPELRNF